MSAFDPFQIYSLALGCGVATLFLYQSSNAAGQWAYHLHARYVRKKLQHPIAFTRPTGSIGVTPLDIITILCFVAANVVCATLRIHTAGQLSLRLSRLCTVNMVMLFVGGRTNLFLDWVIHMPYQRVALIHRWVGRICGLEGVVHAFLGLATGPSPGHRLGTPLLIVVAVLLVTSLLPARRWAYELFLKSHQALAIALLALLWLHSFNRSSPGFVAVVVATSLWLSHTTIWLCHFIWRNFGHGSNHLSVEDLGGASRITISLNRSMRVEPGQYVYLTLPRLATRTYGMFQAHPYYIIATEAEDNGSRARQVHCLVAKRAGFSREISRVNDLKVWIDGPYGKQDFGEFDKVIFFACGVGITAYLFSIRRLLRQRQRRISRIQRILLVWFLTTSEEESWVNDILEDLAGLDQQKILVVYVFRPDRGAGPGLVQTFRKPGATEPGDVARMTHDGSQKLDICKTLNAQYTALGGNMAVSVCGTPQFEEQVRRALALYEAEVTFKGAEHLLDETPDSREARSRFHHGKLRKPTPMEELSDPPTETEREGPSVAA